MQYVKARCKARGAGARATRARLQIDWLRAQRGASQWSQRRVSGFSGPADLNHSPKFAEDPKIGFFREFRLRGDKGTGAADTADTALRPLTYSSAATAPRSKWQLVFVQMPREASKGQGSLPAHFTNSNHHWGAELSCTRSPSAVSGQRQRFQRPPTAPPEIPRRTQFLTSEYCSCAPEPTT